MFTRALIPKPVLPPVAGLETEAYLALAKETGVDVPAFTDRVVEIRLASAGIPLYDYEEVDRFLRRQCRLWKVYIWRALTRTNVYYGGTTDRHGMLCAPPYRRAIPLACLERIRRIQQLFGGQDPSFYISDYAAKVPPDPFLM